MMGGCSVAPSATAARAFLCALVLLAAMARAARADDADADRERILRLDSDIRVAADGMLRVEENISISSTGEQFVHGLERIFPRTYAGPFGSRAEVGFHVEAVQCDGHDEGFAVRRSGRDVTIRIGNPDARLAPGEHRYRIIYLTGRQLGFFRDHDELYWNAVGTSWRLPVEESSATITLPDAARGRAKNAVAYVGPAGSKDRAARASVVPSGGTFAAGRALGAGEGLTIVLEWPKGIVLAPTATTRLRWWLSENVDAVAGLVGLLALVLFVRIHRVRLAQSGPAGKVNALGDGSSGTISPCLLRYIVRGGYDERSLPVALLHMADKGYLTVRESGAHYQLETTDKARDSMAPEEESVWRALFSERRTSVELAPVDAPRLSAAATALEWDLKQRGDLYVVGGRGPAFLGMLMAFGILGMILQFGTGDTHVAVIVGFLFGALGMSLFAIAARLLRPSLGRDPLGMSTGDLVGLALVGILLALVELWFGKIFLRYQLTPLALALSVGVVFLGHRSLRLWRLRTRAGEQLYREALRVRRSLGHSERPARQDSSPPMDASLFPYALALDAVAAWEARVARLSAGSDSPSFRWIHRDAARRRHGFHTMHALSSTTDELSSMIASTVAAAPGTSPGGASSSSSSSSSWSGSSDSGSSSDSGGSSGGGGGGGGGGGW